MAINFQCIYLFYVFIIIIIIIRFLCTAFYCSFYFISHFEASNWLINTSPICIYHLYPSGAHRALRYARRLWAGEQGNKGREWERKQDSDWLHFSLSHNPFLHRYQRQSRNNEAKIQKQNRKIKKLYRSFKRRQQLERERKIHMYVCCKYTDLRARCSPAQNRASYTAVSECCRRPVLLRLQTTVEN